MVNFYQKKNWKYVFIGGIFLISLALVLTGCSSSGGDDEERPGPTVQATVADIDELSANLNSNSASIDFANDISGNAVIDSRTDDLLVNFDDNQLDGDFEIAQGTNDSAWKLGLENGTITGDLTIDDPALTFEIGDNVTINGTSRIINVSDSSFINKGEINNVIISDSDGATFDNQGTIKGNIEISSGEGGAVNLKGRIEKDIKITGNGTKVRVTAGTTVNKIVVSPSASSVKIELDENAEHEEIVDQGENTEVNTILERVPVLEPEGGEYIETQTIEISSGVSGDTIYYTTDGSEPSTSSLKYNDPISINETTTIKAKIINADNKESEVVTEKYIIAGNSISGTVSNSGGGTDNVKAVLISNDNIDNITSFNDIRIEAGPRTVNTDGEFNFINITPGNYYLVAFQDQNDNNELDFYEYINDPSEPFGVYMEDNQEVKISISEGDYLENKDITLADPKSKFITGKVDNISDTSGETYALLIDSSKDLSVLDPAQADKQTRIDSENRYVFSDVEPGSYYIFAYNDQNDNNEIGADLFNKYGNIPAEPLGFYGGYPQVINYTDTSQPLEGRDITISKKMMAVSLMTYDQTNDKNIPLPEGKVELFDADTNNLIISADNLMETTVDKNTPDERNIAFAFLTGLKPNANYYLQGIESNYRGTLSPIFNFNKYDIIATDLELFTEEFISGFFNDSNINSNDALILGVIEDDSLSNKSVRLEGPATYSSTENSGQVGYLASDDQYLDYTLNSFENYEVDENSGVKTFIVGVKKAEPGKYDIYLEGDPQSVDTIYVKEGFLTLIFDYVD
jgi:uncharacterized protein (DUF2141 family)